MTGAAAHQVRDVRAGGQRRLYIDWLRGVAVFVMILWHTVDSWHVREGRQTAGFLTVSFLAGWAAPLFLFLAGVSLPMAGLSRMARGIDRASAARALMHRGWQVFLIAHLFRLQSFLLNPGARWSGLLKPDILNILGLGMVAAAYGWGRADSARARLMWLLLPAVGVVVILTPLAPTWWWPTLMPPRLEAYIRPVGNQGVFSLFPPVGYVFAGAFVGAWLAERSGSTEREFHVRIAIWGIGLLAAGLGLAFLPTPAWSAMWVRPVSTVSWRIGAMLLLLALSWWWLGVRTPGVNNPLMVFGRTSLFVYWVHVELAYGVFSLPLRNALSLPWALTAYALFTVAMYGCAVLWLRRPVRPLVPAHMRAPG